MAKKFSKITGEWGRGGGGLANNDKTIFKGTVRPDKIVLRLVVAPLKRP
jgi:hypothetical protein